jgi:hypothetical protein
MTQSFHERAPALFANWRSLLEVFGVSTELG